MVFFVGDEFGRRIEFEFSLAGLRLLRDGENFALARETDFVGKLHRIQISHGKPSFVAAKKAPQRRVFGAQIPQGVAAQMGAFGQLPLIIGAGRVEHPHFVIVAVFVLIFVGRVERLRIEIHRLLRRFVFARVVLRVEKRLFVGQRIGGGCGCYASNRRRNCRRPTPTFAGQQPRWRASPKAAPQSKLAIGPGRIGFGVLVVGHQNREIARRRHLLHLRIGQFGFPNRSKTTAPPRANCGSARP